MKPPFAWDSYSDQPYQLKDRVYKKTMRRAAAVSLLKTAASALLWLPLGAAAASFLKPKEIETSGFAGLIVDPLREPETALAMVEELTVPEVLVRLKLWEAERLDEIVAFLRRLDGRRLFFVLMQDREHVEDEALRRRSFARFFEALSPFGHRFQIGSTINRAKWGFFSVDEYLRFFKTAQRLRDKRFPGLELVGPGVIDFEYHFAAHALFNLKGVRFDAVSALLYVDRRGAPENTQMGWSLPGKIRLFSALTALSPFARHPFYITETNWPLRGTAPYAPTSEKECVDEEEYASYMVRYYLLALSTGRVETIYWHQLMAPGYGLVDSRGGIRKRSAYAAFKTLTAMLSDGIAVHFKSRGGLYELQLRKPDGLLRAFWTHGPERVRHFRGVQTFTDRDGRLFETDRLTITGAPVYLFEKESD